MSIDLLSLINRFRPLDDRESEMAWFRTAVPWVGPEAYLNIIYKQAEPGLLHRVAEKLAFPPVFVDFLSRQNGANLFSGALNLYGVVQPGQLLNRMDSVSLPPFNIERENDAWTSDKDRLLVVGSYRFNGARACIDRFNSRILVFKKRENTPIASWSGVEDWVIDEVARLGTLFNDVGKRIGLESETGPPMRSG